MVNNPTNTGNSGVTLSYSQVIRFWGTLALSWVFMTVEFALVNALIARLPNPKFNLAAFGITLALVMLCESPIFANISASNALVKDNHSYRLMMKFSHLLGGGMSVVLAFLSLSPIFDFIAYSILELDRGIAHIVQPCLMCMFITPFAVGYRRFYQGILVNFGKVRFVAMGTAVRLSSVIICGFSMSYCSIDGAIVGSLAFMSGMLLEAVFSRLAARGCIVELAKRDNRSDLTMRRIVSFYTPLAITSVILISIHPLTSFFLARSSYPLESLAVFPVVSALILIFKSGGLAFQEVTISALNKSLLNDRLLRHFAAILSLSITFVLLLSAYLGLSLVWFEKMGGLTQSLLPFTKVPFALMALLPGLVVWSAYQRGFMISTGKTRAISTSGLLEVFFVFSALVILIHGFDIVGASAAAAAAVGGALTANLWLFLIRLRNL